MGRSIKCNWKRKQLKANKKKGPVMLTGQQYWDLNTAGYIDQHKSKNKMMVFGKARRTGHNPTAAIIDMMKNFNGTITEDNFKEIKYPYGEPEKLRGGAPDNSYMFRTADGRYIDPELGDIRHEDYKKFWDAVAPKLHAKSNRLGPIIFGTAGHDTVGKGYYDMWQKHQAFNIVAGADAADENYDIHAMDLSLSPLLEKMIAEKKRWRAMYFGDIDDLKLPNDFFEYDPNGRNK